MDMEFLDPCGSAVVFDTSGLGAGQEKVYGRIVTWGIVAPEWINRGAGFFCGPTDRVGCGALSSLHVRDPLGDGIVTRVGVLFGWRAAWKPRPPPRDTACRGMYPSPFPR